jgi:hypothetical protein
MKIDELVLSLVLDVAGLKKGQAATEAALVAIRAESEKTDKSMQDGAKKTAAAAQDAAKVAEKAAKDAAKVAQQAAQEASRAEIAAKKAVGMADAQAKREAAVAANAAAKATADAAKRAMAAEMAAKKEAAAQAADMAKAADKAAKLAEKEKAKVLRDDQHAAKEAQDGADKNAAAVKKWMWAIIGVGTALISLNKFKNFAIDLTNSDAAAGRMAENIGIATQDLTALQGTVDKFGGSADGMASDLFKISQAMAGLKAGEMPFWITDPKGFFQTHMDVGKFTSQTTTMGERVKMLQEAMSKVSMPDAQYAGSKLGLSVGTVQAFHDPGFAKQLALQYKLNAANEADAKLAQQRLIAWRQIEDRLTSLGRVIVTRLSPLFFHLTNDLLGFLSKKENVDAFTRTVQGFADAIAHIDTASLRQVFADIGDILGAVGGVIATAVRGLSNIVDLSMGNTAADHGFLGNMAKILDGMVKSIKFIIDGYKKIGAMVTVGAESAAEMSMSKPTALNGYNQSGAERTGTKATLDVLNGILGEFVTSLITINHSIGEAMIAGLHGDAVDKLGEARGVKTGDLPKFANGGIASGPKSGYLAMLHGTETIIPNAGQRATAQSGGTVNNYYSTTTSDAKITVRDTQGAVDAAKQLSTPKRVSRVNPIAMTGQM